MQQIDLTGASGAVYRYTAAPERGVSTSMGGNYAYVRVAGSELTVVFLGQTDNLLRGAMDHWSEGARHGANRVYIRLNVSSRLRNEELEDLLAAQTPQMNREEARAQA